tara:strand:- start:2434 stop:6063 length:3630 start_codon:yes stop_codon:yes gene_type:complete
MAQAPQTISQASALKISDDPLFYTRPSFLDYREGRIGELNNMAFAKKSPVTDEAYNVLDIIRTAPYETDIAFGVELGDGTSKQFFPDAQERFLQLDFLENVLDDSFVTEDIENTRKKLAEEGYSREILESLYNREQHKEFLKYLKSVKDLEGLEYTPRTREKETPLAPFLPIQIALEKGKETLFDMNEDQRAQAAARGADPDVNYISLVKDSDLKVGDLDAYTDLIRGRQLGSREPDVIEMEDLIHRFDPTAQISPMDFNNPNDGQFVIKSELLTGGKPVPFGNIQPTEDPESMWAETKTILGQEAPSAIVGGGFISLAQKGIRKSIEKQAKRNADRLEKGELDLETSGVFSRTGRIAKLAAVSGIAEAVAEASRLYAGKLTGRNPRMSDYQIFKKSGLAAVYAAAGEFGGELVIKAFGKVKNMFTGERLPETLLARLRASGEILRRKKARLKDETDLDISQTLLNEYVIDAGGEVGEELFSLGDLTQDKVLQAIENNLLQVMDRGSEGYIALNRLLNNQGNSLDRYYEAINIRLGPDQELGREAFNEIVNRIKLERRQKQKEAVEEDIYGIEQQLDLEEIIPGTRPDAPVSDLTDSVQKIVEGGRIDYPEYTSEIMTMYRQYTDPIREEYTEVFDKVVADIDGNDFKPYEEKLVTLPKYVSKQVQDMVRANKPEDRIFSTTDDAEVAEIMRTILQNRADEGISIELLTAPQPFTKQRKVSVRELQQTIDGLEDLFRSHQNPVVRREGKKLIAGLVEAREDAFRILYKKITGAKSAPTLKGNPKGYEEMLNTIGGDIVDIKRRIKEAQDETDGAYIYQIATKEPSELGAYVLNSKPSNLEGLTKVLSQSQEGLEKLQQVRQLVFDALEREVSGDGATRVQQAERLRKLSNRNKEQFEILFPDIEFNPKEFAKLKQDLQNKEGILRQVNALLEGMVNPETGEAIGSPIELVDLYMRMSPKQKQDFRGTDAFYKLQELSKLADQEPNLRTAFKTDLERRMRNLMGLDADTALTRGEVFRKASTRSESGFDLTELQNMFLVPYQNDRSLADDLGLIVGEEDALEYAKHLRNFARRARILTQKEKPKPGDPNKLQTIMDHAAGTITRLRKGFFGQLSRAGYRSNLILDELGPKVADHLAIIFANPKKLDEFMKIYDSKRIPLSDVERVIVQIALGREGAEDVEETEVEQFRRKVSDEFNLPRYDVFMENVFGR